VHLLPNAAEILARYEVSAEIIRGHSAGPIKQNWDLWFAASDYDLAGLEHCRRT
jgi:hypothetical protein